MASLPTWIRIVQWHSQRGGSLPATTSIPSSTSRRGSCEPPRRLRERPARNAERSSVRGHGLGVGEQSSRITVCPTLTLPVLVPLDQRRRDTSDGKLVMAGVPSLHRHQRSFHSTTYDRRATVAVQQAALSVPAKSVGLIHSVKTGMAPASFACAVQGTVFLLDFYGSTQARWPSVLDEPIDRNHLRVRMRYDPRPERVL